MTTFEGVPSLSTFVAMKLTNRISRTRRREMAASQSRARTWVQSLVKFVAQLAGFSLLTSAGFTWNMTAGLIVAGISCFAFAWLMNDQTPEDSEPRHAQLDPMASRR